MKYFEFLTEYKSSVLKVLTVNLIQGMEKECEWFKTGFTKTRASLTLAAETLMEMIAEAGF